MTTTPATQALLPEAIEILEQVQFICTNHGGQWDNDAFKEATKIHALVTPLIHRYHGADRNGPVEVSQAHSLPGDVGTAEALTFIDKFFEPWGSWKTVWWEGEVSDDAAFSADNALKHVANILRRAALTPSALSGDAGEVLTKVKAILEQARDGVPSYRLARINAALAALPSHKGAGE